MKMSAKNSRAIPQILLVIPGLILLAVAVVEILTSRDDAGIAAATMLVVGAVLTVAPFLLDRLEKVEMGGVAVHLGLARAVSESGAPQAARLLERGEISGAVEAYAFVREHLMANEFDTARQILQDALVAKAAAVSSRESFSATEVRSMLLNGPPVVRVIAVGLMRGDPSLVDSKTLVHAIRDSRSANEQYQALLLARTVWRRLSPAEQDAIADAVKGDPYLRKKSGGARNSAASELLRLHAERNDEAKTPDTSPPRRS